MGRLTVSFAPLAVYLLLRHFHLISANVEVLVLTLCVAWLTTCGLKAIGHSDPSSSS
ncbi:hypothetical protein [Amycolatopsis sp. NPDC051071]|uniref:hypothetical protein n=1 Tax=Amycolatopsis sp. NPDC051071 TaxID=3154637 RepID=UPI00342591C0